MTISRRWPAGRDATRDGSFHAAGLDLVCKFWNPSALMTPLLKSGIAAPCHVYAFECCGALIPETVGTAPRVDRSKRRDPTRLSTAVSFRLRVACFMPRKLAARAMLPRSGNQQRKAEGLWVEVHFCLIRTDLKVVRLPSRICRLSVAAMDALLALVTGRPPSPHNRSPESSTRLA